MENRLPAGMGSQLCGLAGQFDLTCTVDSRIHRSRSGQPQASSGLYLDVLARIPLSHSPRQNEGLDVDRKSTKRPSTQRRGLGAILPSTAETFLGLSS